MKLRSAGRAGEPADVATAQGTTKPATRRQSGPKPKAKEKAAP
jgi:hypothetical protein